MRCLKPYHSQKDKRYYPCGRCLTCRVQRREDWTLRMLHELPYWNKAMFVTLTYDNEHLPKDGSLSPEDLSNFFKLLRIRLNRDPAYGKDYRIKYFACGEYGPKTHRPHYHAIIFGLSYSDKHDKQMIIDCWQKCKPHMWLPRWQHGRLRQAIAPVVKQSIRYVAGYVFKKAVDNCVDTWLNILSSRGKNLVPVFQRQSQGIGKRFAFDNRDKILRTGSCYNNPVPRYYRKLLGISEKTNEAFKNICIKQAKYYDEYVLKRAVESKSWVCFDNVKYLSPKRLQSARAKLEHLDVESPWFWHILRIVKTNEEGIIFQSNLDLDEIKLHAQSRRYQL